MSKINWKLALTVGVIIFIVIALYQAATYYLIPSNEIDISRISKYVIVDQSSTKQWKFEVKESAKSTEAINLTPEDSLAIVYDGKQLSLEDFNIIQDMSSKEKRYPIVLLEEGGIATRLDSFSVPTSGDYKIALITDKETQLIINKGGNNEEILQ